GGSVPPLLLCLVGASALLHCGAGDRAPAPTAGGSAPAGRSAASHGAGAAPGGAPSAEESLATGLALFRQGDYKGAEPLLAAALGSRPGDSRLLEALGSVYALTDRFRQAEESFHAALDANPASIGARLGLAAVFVDTGRYEEAARALQDVRARDPGNLAA